MPETGTSGLMSGERKRSAGSQSEPQATAPLLDSTELTVWRCCPERQLLRVDLPSASRLWTGEF